MPLRFTIRDLLWLTLVVALCAAWWLDHKSHRYHVYTLPDGRQAMMDCETGTRLVLE